MNKKIPLIIIVGTTASGKSELAVRLAKKFHGEIVSADSRQVYKEIPIGTETMSKREMRGVPHHLLGITSLKKRFDVVQYQKKAFEAISVIQKKGLIPFLVGGSALYLYAVADGVMFPNVKPNKTLRKQLEKLSVQELFAKLKKLDPLRAKTIEKENPRRLVRALEIVMQTNKPIPPLQKRSLFSPLLLIGVKKSPLELQRRIRTRIQKHLKRGWVAEVKKLLKNGLGEKQIREIGLGYQWILPFLKREISKEELIDRTQRAELDFARRQMSWFKKDPRIHWVNDASTAISLIKGLAQ